MLVKSLTILATLVAMAHAGEVVTCTDTPAGRSIITSITDENNFCTMLTGKGVFPVAPDEGCAAVYCYGAAKNGGWPMPAGYIKSSHYVKNDTYVQITGCMDSTVWAQNPTDEGGQMDSHGWAYTCQGYDKFVSLLEPATNTYCIRCCSGPNVDVDCDTSHSTRGCWNLIPGDYSMADGSSCPLAPGAPNSTVSASAAAPSASGATSLPTLSSGVVPPATSGAANVAATSGTAGGALPTAKTTSAASALVSTGSAIAASLVLAVMAAAL